MKNATNDTKLMLFMQKQLCTDTISNTKIATYDTVDNSKSPLFTLHIKCISVLLTQNIECSLKLVSAIFLNFFSANDSPSNIIKNVFSSKKLFSFSRHSNFCNFFPSFPQFPDSFMMS